MPISDPTHDNVPERSTTPVDASAAEYGTFPKVNGRYLQALCDSLVTRTLHASDFNGITVYDVLHPKVAEHPLLPVVRDVCRLTKEVMTLMNRQHPGLPPDTIERTLLLITAPGAHLVLLEGIDPKERDRAKQSLLGYGIVIKGRKNFPDGNEIPPHLFTSEDDCRVIRLFVADAARDIWPEAFKHLIGDIKEIAGPSRIFGKVLIDILRRKGTFAPDLSCAIWLRAKIALEARGYEDTGENNVEEITHKDGHEVAVAFRWYVYPPFTEKGISASANHQRRFDNLHRKKQERVAPASPVIPLIDGRVGFSGSASDAALFARLYPGNSFIGNIFHSGGAGRAKAERSANLVSQEADIEGSFAPDNSLDVSIVYGVMPDIPNFERYVQHQVRQLREGGFLVIRDTIGPDGPHSIVLQLISKQAESFRRFINATVREPHIPADDWKLVLPLASVKEGTERFVTPYSIGAEFLLKPHAEADPQERARSYTKPTAADRQRVNSAAGLRILFAGPERSAGFYEQYINGKVSLKDLSGARLQYPHTNYITVAQKVAPQEGVSLAETKLDVIDRPTFFSIAAYLQRDPISGEAKGVREVARREGKKTIDVIPYTIEHGRLYIGGRTYPRPIVTTERTVDETKTSGYFIEQIGAIVPAEKVADPERTRDLAEHVLRERGGFEGNMLREIEAPTRYFTRPDMLDEEVIAVAGRLSEDVRAETYQIAPSDSIPAHSRMYDGEQLLQAAQIGIQQDGRIERKLYELFIDHRISPGPWVAPRFRLKAQPVDLTVTRASAMLSPPERSCFTLLDGARYHFLAARRHEFSERTASGDTRRTIVLESVAPGADTGFSSNSVPFIPLINREVAGQQQILVGLELIDFPTVQEAIGSSALATVPTIRLPQHISYLRHLQEFARDRLYTDYGIRCRHATRLGGKYYTSAGITPDAMYPMVGEVDVADSRLDRLSWVPIDALLAEAKKIKCAQLITTLYRAAHMLGALPIAKT